MDADLQDPPDLVITMVEEYQRGYDVLYGQRISRQGESAFKRATARLFYVVMRRLVARELPEDTGDFRLMSRRVVDHLLSLGERDRFLRGLVAWLGYNQKAVPYDRPARAAGVTKYPLVRMVAGKFNRTCSHRRVTSPVRRFSSCRSSSTPAPTR
jgi:dolichol-phosphate mannosyltransferase